MSSLSAGRSTAGPIRMSLNIFLIYILFFNYAVCVLIFMTSLLGVAVDLLSIKEVYL